MDWSVLITNDPTRAILHRSKSALYLPRSRNNTGTSTRVPKTNLQVSPMSKATGWRSTLRTPRTVRAAKERLLNDGLARFNHNDQQNDDLKLVKHEGMLELDLDAETFVVAICNTFCIRQIVAEASQHCGGPAGILCYDSDWNDLTSDDPPSFAFEEYAGRCTKIHLSDSGQLENGVIFRDLVLHLKQRETPPPPR